MVTKIERSIQNDIEEYLQAEEHVAKNFVNGLVKLGEILDRHRSYWKPRRRWEDYTIELGRSMGYVNQIIRLYDYSKKNYKELIDANITNWDKLKAFLPLPNEEKKQLAERISGSDLSTKEFKAILDEDKIEVSNFSIADIKDDYRDVAPAIVDSHFSAKEVVKELKDRGYKLSNYCVPIVEAFVNVEQAIQMINEKRIAKLSSGEKTYLQNMLMIQKKRLEEAIKLLS